MKILRRIKAGHYSKVYEVEYMNEVAIAKFERPITLFTANIETFLGNTFCADNRRYSTPRMRREFEIDKLRYLKNLEINVPRIIIAGTDYFIMEKIPGKTLDEEEPNKDLYERVIQDLKEIHRNFGVYHGSPHPRNIIVNPQGIFWLDWETRLASRSLKQNQERDLIILEKDLKKLMARNRKI